MSAVGTTPPEDDDKAPYAENAEQEQLVIRAQRGDREALQELCQSCARSILFRAQRILDNRMDAEDVAQEVLIKVCTKIKDLKNPKAFNSWLYRILLNEARKVIAGYTRRSISLNVADYLDSIEEEDEDFLPLEYTLREEERKTVIDILDRLSIRQKEAVLLHYFDGLNVTETAEAMGISQQAASRYLKLAREKVRSELMRSQLPPGDEGSGIACLPIASVVSLALQQEANRFVSANNAWLAQAMQECARFFTDPVVGPSLYNIVMRVFAGVSLVLSMLVGLGATAKQADCRSVQIVVYEQKAPNGSLGQAAVCCQTAKVKASVGLNNSPAVIHKQWISMPKSDIKYGSDTGGIVNEQLSKLQNSLKRGSQRLPDVPNSLKCSDCLQRSYSIIPTNTSDLRGQFKMMIHMLITNRTGSVVSSLLF
ncbi:MAG: RNA polymerase sigma factor [Coriobacteriia bacterium]|nr:RNA polymerase sigma factor [Coriobacteriia bacterium]